MKKFVEKDVAENPLYHDTWKLLKKYRDVVWSLEISVQHVRSKFEIEYGTSIEEFLDSIYLAGADLNGSDIEHHAKCIERSHKMLKLLDSAVELLRTRHKNGEAYYWLLYYSFLSPQQLKNVEEIIENLRPHIRDISFRTYYRRRREAIDALSSVLWGYTSKDSLDMCAIGFLKVSQKIDSFMASLGVNVGHTGGSMLAEAMIAARGFSGFKSFASNHFAGGRSSHSSHVRANGGGKGGAGFGAGFASGGLAGVIKRNVTNNAVKTATTPPDAKPSGLSGLVGGAAGGIGGHIYTSSVSKGGNFANNVIGSVATGSITQMGTMTGDKAVEALHSYMGHAALEPGAENIPTYQNVEIGGGRITGTEVTPEHPEGIAFGMYHADQYVAPEGQYTTVHAVDGTAWYKQYAADAVEKSPYMAPDGSIAYHESIVKKLPPTPKRKDKL